MSKVSKQYLLKFHKHVEYKPISFSGTVKYIDFSVQNIYVTESDFFEVKFNDIFDNYVPTFRNRNDVIRWQSNPFKFYATQLNFAIFCATYGCGISLRHLTELPPLVSSVIKFHIYFTVRKILSKLECPLPGNKYFNETNNSFNITRLNEIRREFDIPKTFDFRFKKGRNLGKGDLFWFNGHGVYLVNYPYGGEYVFRSPQDQTPGHVEYLYNSQGKRGYMYFVLEYSDGLTQAGIEYLNDSIRNYVICILGCQVQTRSPILGNKSTSFDSQKQYLVLFEDSVNKNTHLSIPDSIARFQDYVTKARIHLNYVIGPNLYLISNDLNMKINSIQHYNNSILIASEDMDFGLNDINSHVHITPKNMDNAPVKKITKISTHQVVPGDTHVLSPSKSDKPQTASKTSHDNIKLAILGLGIILSGVIIYLKKSRPTASPDP